MDAFWESLTTAQLAGVEAVAMDMWEPYVHSTLPYLSGAAGKIVHDPFHLVKYLNEAVNAVRLGEHRRLQAAGDDTLKGTRQWWLYGFENVPPQHGPRFELIRALNLQTARAWGLKELFRSFWLCGDVQHARQYFAQWYGWAMRSQLEPVKKVARMCKRHLENLLTFFVHRLTNGPIERLNNKIQGLIKKAMAIGTRPGSRPTSSFTWAA